MQEQISAFKNSLERELDRAKKILLTCHKGPDDDAIGSLLSIYQKLGSDYPDKTIEMLVLSDNTANRWRYFPSSAKISFVPDTAKILANYDIIICLDGSQYSRFTNQPERLANFTGVKVCIDHHSSPSDPFDLALIIPESTSTSELIYRLFFQQQSKIPKVVCETLLLGILGDTGMLQYVNKPKSYIYQIVENLVNQGDINIDSLVSAYTTYSVSVFLALQAFVGNLQVKEVKGWPKFTVAFIPKGYPKLHNLKYEDMAEAAEIFRQNFLRSIKEASWGFIVYPKPDGISLSLRSRPCGVNVRKIVEELKVGGGHDLASGGTFDFTQYPNITHEKVIELVVDYLKTHPVQKP